MRWFELFEPPLKSSDLQRSSATAWALFIIAAQSSVTSPAAKHLFDEPSFALHAKPSLSCLLDPNVQFPAELFLHPSFKIHAAKAFIGPNQRDVLTPRSGFDLFKQDHGPGTLAYVGGQYHAFEPVAARITQGHALAPTQFLRSVISTRPPFSVLLTLCESILAAVGCALLPWA